MNRFAKLAWFTTFMTLVLVVVGALVRATGSGLGCPDWPRCYGSWIPPMRAASIIEYSHRLTASVVGALVLYLAIVAWLRHRSMAAVFWPAFGALVTVIVQAGIGRQVVLGELPRNLVVLHFSISLALLGLLTLASANASQPRGGRFDAVAGHCLVATTVAVVTLLAGAFVVQWGAGSAFPDWPLMNGSVAPPEGGLQLLHYFHRALAAVLGLTLGHLAIRVTRRRLRDRALVILAHGAFSLWLAQVLLGGANVLTRSAPWTVVAHVSFGALLWVSLVTISVIAYRRAGPAPSKEDAGELPERVPAGAGGRIKAYFMLTKPRIIELLLITTVPAMIAAEGGWPSIWLMFATLVGGSLAAGSANAINCYLDRDIDEKMKRTSTRPLPSHQVKPANALRFGIVLGLGSLAWLTWTVNRAAAALAGAAILFYVFVYTMALKRSTPSNIVIGGAAGAAPVLVGWAAVTGGVGRFAWVLFAIIFYWTPPHFWALALRYSDEYAAAKVPMLPVVQGVKETTRQIFLYSVVLFAVSLLAYPVGGLGVLYLASALLLGAVFIGYSLRLRSRQDPRTAMGMFRYSISYLVLLFVALAMDRLIDAPGLAVLDGWVLDVAAGLFVLFEGAILISVLRYRDRSEPPARRRLVAVELAWTVLPLLMVGALFLLSWQPAALAAP
ncbi:MAG TPA: heme o synthase [Actinomycetota bacterium]|nr:heme o synthase [Actinomycetota bacterium]